MRTSRLLTIAVAFSLTIVRLPVYFGHQAVLEPVALLALVACLAWALPRQPSGTLLNRHIALAFGLAAITGMARLRGAHLGVYGSMNSALGATATYLLVVALGAAAIATAVDRRELHQRIAAVVLAPAIYTATNVLMYLAGLRSPTEGTGFVEGTEASLLTSLGHAATRIKFPMADSINLFGVVAAAGTAGVLLLYRAAPGVLSRWWTIVAVAAGLYALLYTDARVSMALVLAVTIWLLAKRKVNPWLLLAVIPLMPLLVTWGLSLVGTGLNAALSRQGGGGDLYTASNRLYIWQGAWKTLKHPDLHWVYGWGADGQDVSGAALHYDYLFPNVPGPSLQAHSVVIQTVLDSGLIGLSLLAGAGALAAWQLQRFGGAARALLAILLVVILNGATESSPTYWSDEALITVLLVMGAAAGLRLRTSAEPDSEPAPETSTELEPAYA